MNKNECVDKINNRTGLSKKDCKLCLDAILFVIADALKKGECVTLPNFGRFKTNEVKAKNIYNFKTRRTNYTEAKRVPTFRASENLKQSIR